MESAIIVFSHLRWEFLYQRPQQLMSRLAAMHPIVYIEEPLHHAERTFLKTWSPAPNVLICQPYTPVDMPGFHDDHLPHLQTLIRQVVRDYDEHIAWFCTPMALPLLQDLRPRLVVYDCMDDLAAQPHAPRQLPQRENALLKVADVVFAAGRSLERSLSERHQNVHLVPNSVHAEHFLPALDRSNSHHAHREIPGPRLGFYGTIDERFDAELIGRVADAHPMWQIVLVGPVSRIDPGSLPQRANIHYLGHQPYDAMPHFLAGWDVCLLPYVVDESTRNANPTKILEYMAAELPIVSTPLPDVIDNYGDLVHVAADAPAFVAGCEAALLAAPEHLQKKVERMRTLVDATSWDATVASMRELLACIPVRSAAQRALTGAAVDEFPEAADDPTISPLRRPPETRYAATLIIGAGASGLSAAFALGHDALVLERNDRVGGNCRSVRSGGFTFDYGGRMLHPGQRDVMEMYETLLGSNVHWQEQTSLVCGADGSLLPLTPATLEGLPPELIAEGVAGARYARFGYPLRGGFQSLMSGFVPHIKGTIELNAEVALVSPQQRLVVLADGRRFQYDSLISTMPLPALIDAIGEEAPPAVRHAARMLRHYSLRCVNLGVARARLSPAHWLYTPRRAVFHRVFMQGNASPDCNATGGFGITCEIYHSPARPLPAEGTALIETCIRDCVSLGILRDDDRVLVAEERDVACAGICLDAAGDANAELVRSWLAARGIVPAGRFGAWIAGDTEHAFRAGRRAAEAVMWARPETALAADF